MTGPGSPWPRSLRAHLGEAADVYTRLEPGYTLIVSDGAYGIGGFAGDPTSARKLADWYALHLAAWDRLAAPSSSLYFWGAAEGCARMLVPIEAAGWRYYSRIVWNKGMAALAGRIDSEALRGWPTASEDCYFFVRESVDISALAQVELGADGRNTILAFLRSEWMGRASLTVRDAETAWGSTASHYFRRRSQWEMPTWEAYLALAAYAAARVTLAPGERPILVTATAWETRNGGDPLRASYEGLRAEHDGLRAEYGVLRASYEGLRYPFALPAGVSDVWTGAPVTASRRHPCAKRQEHIDRIVLASSRPGDRVLEPFGGGAPVLRACRRLGRGCDSIERDPEWHAAALAVLGEVGAVAEPGALAGQGSLFGLRAADGAR